MEVFVEKKVLGKFKKLPSKIRIKASSVLKELKKGFSAKLDIKKLKGLGNHYRIRIGKYRILFYFYEEKIIVYDLLPRKKAYE